MSNAHRKQTKANTEAHAEPTNRPPRFQKHVHSQGFLQEDYEQNVMGATAGVFCAIWAGHLLGERLSMALTTWSPADDQGIHRLLPSDLSIVVLLASKLLFLRALSFRYVLRPMLKCLGIAEFVSRQSMAATIAGCLSALLAFCPAIWVLCDSNSDRHRDGLSTMHKGFIIGQSAAQVAAMAIEFLESNRLDRVLAQYLMAGSLFSAGMLRRIHAAAMLVCAWELPRLVTGLLATLEKLLERPCCCFLQRISLAFSPFALVIMGPWLVYTVAKASLLQEDVDSRSLLGARLVFCISLAALSLLELNNILSFTPAAPAPADVRSEKIQ